MPQARSSQTGRRPKNFADDLTPPWQKLRLWLASGSADLAQASLASPSSHCLTAGSHSFASLLFWGLAWEKGYSTYVWAVLWPFLLLHLICPCCC